MKKLIPLAGVLQLILITGIYGQQAKKIEATSKINTTATKFRSPFRYVVISGVTALEKQVNDNPYDLSVDVLMEDRAFTEANLKILFQLVSARFTKPPTLIIHVFTSLDAIRTPEEYERESLVGPVKNYHDYKYAFYTRDGHGESFQYGIPNLVTPTVVVIKPRATSLPPK